MRTAKRSVRGNGDKVRRCLSALAAGSLTAIAAGAGVGTQPATGGPASGANPAAQPAGGVRLEDLPPSVRLGARVSGVRSQISVISAVVVVPDTASYIAAVSTWTTRARFPILIDDGSWESAEAVARFVRSFKPERVVRFASDSKPGEGEEGLRGAVERAAAAAWGCDDPARLFEHWNTLKFTPPGVVVAHPSDPAWTGALALAAGHGQPIIWLNARPWGLSVDHWLPYDKLAELVLALHAELKTMPWKWDALGDEIDAVTLCQNAPVKVSVGEISQTSTFAVMDVIGRPSGVLTLSPTEPGRTARWAWAGQVIGNEWQAAYAAMSSLFLSPESAWLFDGYDDGPPWNGWDATAAAGYFQKAGLQTLVDDGARRGLEDWRRRGAGQQRGGDPGVAELEGRPGGLLPSRRGVNASLVFVNSSGNAEFFDLKPGQGKPGDAPFLHVPSAVHFVHSWSATMPGNRDTVAGRWLERGAFAYLGSTYEPYLQAFVPTPVVAQRLLMAMPFGAAVRMDRGEAWKLTVIGDPLYVAARPVARAPLPMPGAMGELTPVATELSGQLKERKFEDALKTLRLLGRDEEAARLLGAIIKDQPEALSAEVALAGLTAAFIELHPVIFAKVYEAALPRIAEDPALAACKDMIWHSTVARAMEISELEADMLAQSLRPGSLVRDASEASRAMKRARGAEASRSVIARAKAMAVDEATRAEIERLAP